MKITAIETCLLTVPTPKPMSLEFANHKLVVADIATDEGLRGMGYSLVFGGGGAEAVLAYLDARLKPLLLNEDPLQVGPGVRAHVVADLLCRDGLVAEGALEAAERGEPPGVVVHHPHSRVAIRLLRVVPPAEVDDGRINVHCYHVRAAVADRPGRVDRGTRDEVPVVGDPHVAAVGVVGVQHRGGVAAGTDPTARGRGRHVGRHSAARLPAGAATGHHSAPP